MLLEEAYGNTAVCGSLRPVTMVIDERLDVAHGRGRLHLTETGGAPFLFHQRSQSIAQAGVGLR